MKIALGPIYLPTCPTIQNPSREFQLGVCFPQFMYGRLGSMQHTGIGPSGSDKKPVRSLATAAGAGTPSMNTPLSAARSP